MPWADATSVADLVRAFRENRFADGDALVDALIGSLTSQPRKLDDTNAMTILATLQRYARFQQLYRVADLLKASGQTASQVRRQLVQARIERGDVTEAIEELVGLRETLEARRGDDGLSVPERESVEFELGEALGLLGRAYKQLYVKANPRSIEPRSSDLDRSLDYYGRAYRERLGDFMWHGINHIALMTRAERVKAGQANVTSDDAEREAETILQAIREKENRGPIAPWDAAIRAEALLAKGRNPEAVEAVKAYLETPGLDAFAVQSTRRQFEEIWLLRSDTYPGSEILPMMTAKFAKLGGGGRDVDLTALDPESLERIWDDTKYKPIQWLREALDRACCVARLGPNAYEGWGTGFLISGAWIDDGWKDRHLLLTNAHVCTDDPEVQMQYPYPKGHAETKVAFLELGDSQPTATAVDVVRQIWTSPPSELDATLLEIEKPPARAMAVPSFGEPPKPDGEDARVNILGHPKGLGLRVSMQDNKLVAVGDRFLHYRTPTDPGSSGSPIFDQEWRLVGLHHSASRAKQSNEGIRMDRILDKIRAVGVPV